MVKGDLVNLYSYSPHDSDLANRMIYRGILLQRIFGDSGWIVLVEGEPRTFHKTWWICKKTSEGVENER
jgi:hypothetical protein